ncbi:MAG: pantoate--beta-alanine ligase [Gammaproteobacteria bacterium]|nr:pantoate--beta-alanine ligase [Gammaproteobacteria bacterium]MDH3857541.1 pantoate--beta-alanine ligase [Gammaproteobacteria bacterium]
MYQATSVTELQQYVQHWKDHDQSIAFIPTMGNLHAGHMSLIEKGQSLCDRSICSIFVNPMQFGPNEDWDHYPRSLDQDLELLKAIGCDLVYLPTASELYPDGLDKISQVQVTDLTDHYEGAHRPGHFTGVATVVLKLFNIVKPDVSVFGKKDFQQYRVISKMVDDFNIDVQIIGQETTREASGLATSSRNQYLDEAQIEKAALIFKTLQQTAQQIDAGERDFVKLQETAISILDKAGFKIDYFTICNAETLLPATPEDRDLVILVTAALGQTRLLDNIELSLW